jgi:hypothetical protein
MSATPPETPKKDEKAPPAAPPAPPSTPASAPPPADPTPPSTARAPSDISSKKKKGKAAAAAESLPSSTSPSNISIGFRQVEVQSFADIRPALQKWLKDQDKLFGEAEKSSGVEREKVK